LEVPIQTIKTAKILKDLIEDNESPRHAQESKMVVVALRYQIIGALVWAFVETTLWMLACCSYGSFVQLR
jgi:hypothetical protein